jgi:hypothetical protein
MPKTITTVVYEYGELSPKAQEAARDWFREALAGDSSFAESVYSDAVEVADVLGITISTTRNKPHGPAIFFSGFSSQGDGASFEGTYTYRPGALRAVKEHFPKDAKLHAIAQALEDVQKHNGKSLQAICKVRGNYVHSGCMDVEVYDRQYIGADEWTPGAETELTRALRRFADWIYSQLEAAYEDENSDEHVAETIEANGYTFTEKGKRFG